MPNRARLFVVPALLAGLLAGLVASPLVAQRAVAFDASIGISSAAQRHALSAWYPVAEFLGRVRLDLGVRATSYGRDAAPYTNRGTVSAGFPVTLSIPTAVVGLNAAVQADVLIAGPVSVGFNLDLAGFATGGSKSVGSLSASVQTGSLFLGGAPDVGALNSETYIAVRLTDGIVLRAGTSHYVTNYSVSNPLTPTAASVRYQKFADVPFVSVRLRF